MTNILLLYFTLLGFNFVKYFGQNPKLFDGFCKLKINIVKHEIVLHESKKNFRRWNLLHVLRQIN